MAITAVAAIVSAGAVAEGIVAIETLATIATITSVVGAVTGNKTLMSLGAGMGLGSLGAGLAGLGSAAEGTAASATGELGSAATDQLGNAAADAATNTAADAGAVTGAVTDPAAGLTQYSLDGAAPAMNGAAPAAAESAAPIGNAADAAAAPASTTTDAASAGTGPTQAAPDINAPNAPAGASGPNAPTSPADNIQTTGDFARYDRANLPIDNGSFQSSSSFFGDTLGKVGTWMNSNKTLAAGLMNLGGGMAQGAAKMYEADRQYGINQSLLQLKQQEAANAKAQPNINMTVNPNAAVFSNPPQNYAGIIAGARGK